MQAGADSGRRRRSLPPLPVRTHTRSPVTLFTEIDGAALPMALLLEAGGAAAQAPRQQRGQALLAGHRRAAQLLPSHCQHCA